MNKKEAAAKCYLMDLERSIKTGVVTYWKPNLRGYTCNLDEAGLYSKDAAHSIANDDLDKTTMVINQEVVKRLV